MSTFAERAAHVTRATHAAPDDALVGAAAPRRAAARVGATLTWAGPGDARSSRALLVPIVLAHAGLLWALVQSLAPAILTTSTPAYVQWLPDAGPRAPVPPPQTLPTPERTAPQAPWMPVPDVALAPPQADPDGATAVQRPAPPDDANAATVAVPSAAPPVPSRPAPPERQVSISGVAYLAPPVLEYPLAARRRREEGAVHVRVRVDAGGRPDQAAVIRSSGHATLDQAALAAVRATRFKPYTEDGVPRPFWVVMPLVFELES